MSDANFNHDSNRLPADLSGRQIGTFHFLRRLGKGAMAEVYLAEQTNLKRWVAVKILRPELADDSTCVRRFEREAQAAAKLVHANIVQIYEVGHLDGLHYIAQEYVQGQNLRDWLARNGPPLLQPALSVMRQIAAALAKAAEEGVVHRDIKPENIMITAAGEVKVADFGLARVLSENDAAATALTQVGVTMGTPLYMSPEQVEGRPLDPRSDIYSFGVLCYHLLTGKPPFTGDTALAVAVQHVKKQPQPLEAQRPDLPPALCRVVHQMLAKDPEQRWSSCGEILRELYRIQLDFCPQATPEELAAWSSVGMVSLSDPRMRAQRQLAEAMRSTTRERGSVSRWLVAAGVAVMFVLGGVTAWGLRPPRLEPPEHSDKAKIKQQETELRQWLYASRIGTAEAWESVIDYPGVTDLTKMRAQQQLARIYFLEDRLDLALPLFKELAALKDAEFKAFGLAGECVIYERQNKVEEASNALTHYWEYRNQLPDNKFNTQLKGAVAAAKSILTEGNIAKLNERLSRDSGSKGP